MGTENFIYNTEKQMVFELGKLLPVRLFYKPLTKDTLRKIILEYFDEFPYSYEDLDHIEAAHRISKNILDTVGIDNIETFTDYTDWEDLEKIQDCIVVGSVYHNSKLIGQSIFDIFAPIQIKEKMLNKTIEAIKDAHNIVECEKTVIMNMELLKHKGGIIDYKIMNSTIDENGTPIVNVSFTVNKPVDNIKIDITM